MADFTPTASDNDLRSFDNQQPYQIYDYGDDDVYSNNAYQGDGYLDASHHQHYPDTSDAASFHSQPHTASHTPQLASQSHQFPSQGLAHDYRGHTHTNSVEVAGFPHDNGNQYYYDGTVPDADSTAYAGPRYSSQYFETQQTPYDAVNSDASAKRRLGSYDEENGNGAPKKEASVARPSKPVRQQSNPNIPKRKVRPQLNKSYSYTIDSNNTKPVAQSMTKSLFESKKKPNFHLNLDHLKSPSVQSFESFSSQLTPTYGSVGSATGNLHIHDSDLNFEPELENITPSMKPPGTNEHDYFETFLTPSHLHPANDLTGGFDFGFDKDFTNDQEAYDDEGFYGSNNVNPHINVNEYSNVHDYSYDDNDHHHNHSQDYTQHHGYQSHDQNHNQNSMHHNQSTYSTDNSGHENSNFDRAGYNQNDAHYYDTSNESEKGKLSFTELNIGKKSPQTPLSNSPTSRSPNLLRTLSNQSTSSVASGSSFKEGTVVGSTASKKKKIPKGSTCSICGKYISRDLSRHLRIHDEIGRFRCVFPNYCTHKTDKLPLMGNCKHCNHRSNAGDWLEQHVLTEKPGQKCPYVSGVPNPPH